MAGYIYKNGILGAETSAGWKDLRDVIAPYNRPVYIYNTSSVQKRIDALKKSLSGLNVQAHYAMKANANGDILSLMKKNSLGVDVVSLGEAQWALKNGFEPKDIIFSGVGKSKEELTFAVQNSFFQINVESLPELERLGGISQALQTKASVGLRLNPDIKVDTHPYITTGFRENKFGIPDEQIPQALAVIQKYSPWLELKGLSSHIGSQIRDLTPLIDSLKALLLVSQQLMAKGYNLQTIDIGGGLGIDYHSDNEESEFLMIAEFGQQIKTLLEPFKGKLLLEPGRWLVGRCGVLCAQVEYVKFNGHKNFVILNTGMNHLLRPALYKAFHRALPVEKPAASNEQALYDIVGPICESSDVLGHDRLLHKIKEGEWFALMDAGAYGMSMSSYYNRHDFPPEIII